MEPDFLNGLSHPNIIPLVDDMPRAQGPTLHGVLDDIDTMLTGKRPAIELIYKEPLCIQNPNGIVDKAINYAYTAGHCALRVGSTPTHPERVYNVSFDFKKALLGYKEPLITYLVPVEYFFGTTSDIITAGNGGLYQNSFVGVRVEQLNMDVLNRLHHFYEREMHRDKLGELAYSLTPIHSVYCGFVRYLGIVQQEYRNCSDIAGQALLQAGLIDSVHSFPKRLLLTFLHTQSALHEKNVNIVYYQRADEPVYQVHELTSCHGYIHSMQNQKTEDFFWDMKDFAHINVSIPVGSLSGVAHNTVPQKSVLTSGYYDSMGPAFLRPLSPHLICFASAIATILYPIGYWLHFVVTICSALIFFHHFAIEWCLIQFLQLTISVPLFVIATSFALLVVPGSDTTGCLIGSWTSFSLISVCSTNWVYLVVVLVLSLATWVIWDHGVYRGFAGRRSCYVNCYTK